MCREAEVQRYLYRGVNAVLHEVNAGRLVPKERGVPFAKAIYWGGEHYWGDGSTFGVSATNAVIQHQRDSSKNPTSGVSTTPSLENAKQYATRKGEYLSGHVYKIDTELIEKYGVSAYSVSEHATAPAILDDEEVILVAKDFGPLPGEIIIEVFEIFA